MRQNRKIPARNLEWTPPAWARASWDWRFSAWFNFSSDAAPDLPPGVTSDLWEGKHIESVFGVVFSKYKWAFIERGSTPSAFVFVVSPVVIETTRGKNKALWAKKYLSSSPHPVFGKQIYERADVSNAVQFFPKQPVSEGHIKYFKNEPLLECVTKDTAEPALSGYLEHFLLNREIWAWPARAGFSTKALLHAPWSLWACAQTTVAPEVGKLLSSPNAALESCFVAKGSRVYSK